MTGHTPNRPRLAPPTRLPSVADEAHAAWRTGWWQGKVIGICLGMALAVLLGWVR
jgi:hypothetical protein